jgi:hypothetical protein
MRQLLPAPSYTSELRLVAVDLDRRASASQHSQVT